MERSWWAKVVGLFILIGVAAASVYPTLSGMDIEKTNFPFKKKINLGLDLQGGLYLVLGVDFNQVYKEIVERQGVSLENRLKEKNVAAEPHKLLATGEFKEDPRFEIAFPEASKDQARTIVKEEFPNLRMVGEGKGSFQFALANTYRREVRSRTVDQSIEVIRNRIDEFGVAEPSITSQGDDRVVVELPGIREIDRAKELIGRTAKLEFKKVDDESMPRGQLATLIEGVKKEKNIEYVPGKVKLSAYVAQLNEALKGKLPEGRVIAFERAGAGDENEGGPLIPYLLFEKTEVTGNELSDAQVGTDHETNRPEVNFSFNPRGAKLFEDLTAANIGKRIAIVLDNTVVSAPVIQSRIGAHGRITLGRGDYERTLREARDLAIVLRAGALPAQLEFLEQRVVGPSLGQDSIKSGAKAGVIGCLLVFVFMIIYYRMSGLVASISLALNGLFTFAILIGIDATLTLPGIAGIALTIGMAVDSNVLIFERIRDELTEGKTVSGAIHAGFGKAFTAIFDANITHGIIAVILMSYGTGPIRGFAVTLLIGILTTLFCAITVCKLFFDGYLGFAKSERKSLSI